MKVLSVGEMVIDFLPGSESNSYIRKAGGAPANMAIALARQGCDISFCRPFWTTMWSPASGS